MNITPTKSAQCWLLKYESVLQRKSIPLRLGQPFTVFEVEIVERFFPFKVEWAPPKTDYPDDYPMQYLTAEALGEMESFLLLSYG